MRSTWTKLSGDNDCIWVGSLRMIALPNCISSFIDITRLWMSEHIIQTSRTIILSDGIDGSKVSRSRMISYCHVLSWCVLCTEARSQSNSQKWFVLQVCYWISLDQHKIDILCYACLLNAINWKCEHHGCGYHHFEHRLLIKALPAQGRITLGMVYQSYQSNKERAFGKKDG